jgi:hypothetical protein
VISLMSAGLLIGVSLLALQPVVLGLSLLILAVAYAYSPRGYGFSEQSLVVKRLIGDVAIPLEDVRAARRVTSDDLRGCMRLWGSGGLFGYYGLFRTSFLGRCTWYVTNRQKMVVLVTGSKTALFSPDDVDGFLAAIPGVPPTLGHEAPAGKAPSSWFMPSVWIGVAVAIPGLIVAALAIQYSPGPPEVTLTRDSLTIHDRFYSVTLNAADVDVSQVRTIDFQRDAGWRPAGRTNGFSNSHYHSGWYRVANGQKVRLYWANGSSLVLLPPKGNQASVLLEVKDPERFMDDLRKEWGTRP